MIDGVHPLDFVKLTVRQWRFILTGALVVGLLTFVAVYFFMSVKYESDVVFLPPIYPGQPLTGGTLLELELSLGQSKGVKKKDAQAFWGIVLTTRSVSDYMINRFDLWKEYKTDDREAAERKLARRTTVETPPPTGLITIRVKDPDPVRAAQLANGYVTALQEVSDALAMSEAHQRQAFFQDQVSREKEQLQRAENKLTSMQQKTGIVTLRGQTGMALGQIAGLNGRIQALAIEMKTQSSAETEQDPDMIRMQADMDGLKAELARLEQQSPDIEAMGDIGPNSLPSVGVDYMRVVRDLMYHESLYQALAKHAAGAQMDLSRRAPLIEVMEPAIPADKPSGLPRWADVLVGMVAGAFLGWAAGLGRELYRKTMRSPSGKYRRQLIRRELQKKPSGNVVAA